MADGTERTGTFSGADGIEIFYRHYPAEKERARLVIAHGLGEHSGRYGNLVDALVPTGISIWAPDHRGHGKSGGQRGHLSAFQQYLDDLAAMVRAAKAGAPPAMKCFLLGHSMGGLIAVRFVQAYPKEVAGLILSSPALGTKVKIPAFKRIMGKAMSSIRPSLSLANGLDPAKISHDETVVRMYVEDPLVHNRVTARWFTEYLAAKETANAGVETTALPILMQVAGDDHLVDAEASRRFFERLRAEDRTLHVYDGLYHEVYNEPPDRRARVLADLEAWLRARVQTGAI